MVEQELASKIMDAVDAGFDEQIAFTQELVRCPSTRGQEAPAQDLMAHAFRDHGFDVDRFRLDPEVLKTHEGHSNIAVSYDNAWSVVGSWRPANPKGRSLIMNGHVDVVPEGPHDMWTAPPYDPVIKDGWMYGRGAGDMKAGVVAYLYAMAALRRAGLRPAATVHMESVIEEECTGNGALSCLLRGYHGDMVLIPEPTGERLVSAQTGSIWMQVLVRGTPVHASVAGTGQNAIEACVPLWTALHALEAHWNKPENKHPAMADQDHPINLVVSKIEGGDWTSSVPAWCRFDVRIGIYPDVDPSEIQEELKACIMEASKGHPILAENPPEIRWHGFRSRGYVLRGGEDGQAALEAAHEMVNGAPLRRGSLTAVTDSRFRGLYDNTPGLVYGPVAEAIHGNDERVNIESIRRCTRAISLFIADWCGVEAA